MRATTVRRLMVAPLAVALIAGAATAAQGVPADDPAAAVLRYQADPEAHPVRGGSGVFQHPEHEVVVMESGNTVRIDAASWSGWDAIRIELRSPDGRPLGRGALQQGQDPETLKTLVISRGLGCLDARAAVLIERIDRDDTGALTALDATFEHRCNGSGDQALRGQVHFRA